MGMIPLALVKRKAMAGVLPVVAVLAHLPFGEALTAVQAAGTAL